MNTKWLILGGALIAAAVTYLVTKKQLTIPPPVPPAQNPPTEPTPAFIASKVRAYIRNDPSYWDNVHEIYNAYVYGEIPIGDARRRTKKLDDIYFYNYREYLLQHEGI